MAPAIQRTYVFVVAFVFEREPCKANRINREQSPTVYSSLHNAAARQGSLYLLRCEERVRDLLQAFIPHRAVKFYIDRRCFLAIGV